MRTTTAIVTVGLLAWGLAAGAKAAHALAGAENNCRAGQLRCLSKLEAGLLRCHAKAERTGTAVSGDCTARSLATFATCLQKIENKGGCLTTGNGGTLQSATQVFVDDAVVALDPGFPTPVLNTCSAGKKRCVATYAKTLLGCKAKAAKAGTTLDPSCVQKAKNRLDGGGEPSHGCFAKREAKPPCLTTNDVASLEDKADHYVNAVAGALFPPPPVCGDDVVNRLAEECDGVDDAACPDGCGAPGGFMECLCLTIQRERIVEHANADLDIGWTGLSHDSHIVEGGGYTADLWDCDGPGGPDSVCIVGPSCSLSPHSPCGGTKNGVGPNVGPPYEDGDAICAALGQGTCRKTRGGATGPHCDLEFKKECDNGAQCPMPGDRCVKVPHGAPLPLSAGSIQVCIVNTFTEDVVGTTDLADGSRAVRVRQLSKTYLGSDPAEPCPVCGGFCAAAASGASPGGRLPCTTNADCLSSPHVCVTDLVCSYGANQDQPCRPDPPFGGPTGLFGNPSIDCPVNTGTAPLGQPNIVFDPATTGMVTLSAPQPCTAPGFGTACVQGGNHGRPCTTAGDCPGGVCQHQCLCLSQLKPNDCEPACAGGTNDAAACEVDSECPGSFCHIADCRLNPGDTDSSQEGICTVGPVDRHCSFTAYKGCTSDADCQPSPACPRCQAGEVCQALLRQCFVNPIERSGSPGMPDRVGVATFCVSATSSAAVNTVSGLPGPGALTQPETTLAFGF